MTKPLAEVVAELEERLAEVRLERAYHQNRLRRDWNRLRRDWKGTYSAHLQRNSAREAIRLLYETELDLMSELERLPGTAWYGRLGTVGVREPHD